MRARPEFYLGLDQGETLAGLKVSAMLAANQVVLATYQRTPPQSSLAMVNDSPGAECSPLSFLIQLTETYAFRICMSLRSNFSSIFRIF